MTTVASNDPYTQRPAEVYERYARYVNHRFARVVELIGFDKVFSRAEGAWVWDQDGRKYLDFLGGYSVFNVGRNHPRVKRALIDWLERDGASMVQMECSPLAALLGEQLAALTPGDLDTTFFTNSGSETTEVGLKMARKATRKPRILYADLAFHGLTYGAISVSDDDMWREGLRAVPSRAATRSRSTTCRHWSASWPRATWRRSSRSRSRAKAACACRPMATCLRRRGSATSTGRC